MLPRTDGLYFAIHSSTSVAWLRFTEDRSVFGVSSSPGCPEQIASWLRNGAAEFIPQGQYTAREGAIDFTLLSVTNNLGKRDQTQRRHRATITDEGRALSTAVTVESTDPAYNGKSYGESMEFVEVERRSLDGAVKPTAFRALSSIAGLVKHGFDPAMVAAVKKNKRANLAALNVYDRARLLGLGLDAAFVDALIAWRVK